MFDETSARVIVQHLVTIHEALKTQTALLRTLIDRQDEFTAVLRDLWDEMEGGRGDDPWGLFDDDRDDDAARDP